jgi:thiosulfate dehydrogenase (quinone) large subunit
MAKFDPACLSPSQRFVLVVLRICIGWHFLYEGYFKLILPAWAADGTHLGPWSSYGYLEGASGPVGHLLHALFNSGYGHIIDVAVIATLWAIGLSLMLGFFTQAGCCLALCMLSLFYLTAIPLDGVPHPGMEGNYLLINKTLIEWLAVAVVLFFQTGRIAGLDLLYFASREKRNSVSADGAA